MNPTLTPSPFTSPDIRPTRPAPARPVHPDPQDPVPVDPPPWSHRLLPPSIRGLLAELGWWQDPAPLLPSTHLMQTLGVLRRYGWCQSLDVTPTGRLCIRGAQNVLEKTGHTTPHGRERAVAYMQQALAEAGIRMEFFAWNDLPDQQFSAVEQLLTRAADLARQNGE
ncbi:hypothetical protein ABZ802_31430 [Streptomyces sp. NPDC047737]|uniref:DUF6197 family protein n=1 Tax=Streptomyces sp. NPDC047737 TaxID=3155740 RepID=UPI0034091906